MEWSTFDWAMYYPYLYMFMGFTGIGFTFVLTVWSLTFSLGSVVRAFKEAFK